MIHCNVHNSTYGARYLLEHHNFDNREKNLHKLIKYQSVDTFGWLDGKGVCFNTDGNLY